MANNEMKDHNHSQLAPASPVRPLSHTPAALSRRTALAGVLSAASGLACAPAHATASPAARIVSLDWSLVEVALAIGATPVAASEAPGYRQWVGEPRLPQGCADLGLRVQPNLELLQILAPSLVLTIPERNDVEPTVARIAPLVSLPIYTNAFRPFDRACAVTRELGEKIGLETAARAAVERAEAAIETARKKLPANLRPALVIRFVDARNVFVFGRGGLFDEVLTRMGMTNGWPAPPNQWGFLRTSVLALAQADPRSDLYIVNPVLPPDVVAMMRDDPLWRAMPFVRRGAVTRLPPVWFFGATEAAARFATFMASAVTESGQPVVPHAG